MPSQTAWDLPRSQSRALPVCTQTVAAFLHPGLTLSGPEGTWELTLIPVVLEPPLSWNLSWMTRQEVKSHC